MSCGGWWIRRRWWGDEPLGISSGWERSGGSDTIYEAVAPITADQQEALSMSTLFEEAKKLPVSQRIELVEEIWDSIAEEAPASLTLSADEWEELDRRVAAHQADPSTAVPWENFREKLFTDAK